VKKTFGTIQVSEPGIQVLRLRMTTDVAFKRPNTSVFTIKRLKSTAHLTSIHPWLLRMDSGRSWNKLFPTICPNDDHLKLER
jgi:hypothetical protein